MCRKKKKIVAALRKKHIEWRFPWMLLVGPHLISETACVCLCFHVLSHHTSPGGPSLSCFEFSPVLCHRCQAKQVGEIRVEILVQTPDTQAIHVWYTLHTQVKRYLRPKKSVTRRFHLHICCRAFVRVSALCTQCNPSLCFHSVFCTEIYSVHDDVTPEFATHPSVVDLFLFLHCVHSNLMFSTVFWECLIRGDLCSDAVLYNAVSQINLLFGNRTSWRVIA